MQILRETLGSLEVGPSTTFGGLTHFPLLDADARRPEYATLDEAIEQGWLEIREVSAGGSVPELTVVNKGDRAVFMMDGEELVGAKQNRVLNLTILVPPGKTLVVPVSCVEQGRWATRSSVMSSSGSTLYAKLRMAKLASVSRNYATIGRARSDQTALWRDLADKADALDARSPTGAMADIYEKHRHSIADYENAFEPAERQRGAIFAIGDRVNGLELFEHPDFLRKMFRKVVRSYALDAIGVPDAERTPGPKAAREFASEIAEGRTETFPAVGLGRDVRISGPRVTGAALLASDRIVHLCAFRTEDDSAGGPGSGRFGRISSASGRQRSI